MIARRTLLAATALAVIALGLPPAAEAAPPSPQPPATQPGKAPANLPHVTVDRQAGHVDLDATIVLREGNWLELLACSPQTKEHESILTVAAQPSHIHLALLMLGLEPGAPYQPGNDGEKPQPPRGPRVAVTILYPQNGKTVETPAHHWVQDQKAKKPLADNVWLFTGSRFDKYEDRAVYRADINGCVLSLVSFGDEVLARPTTMTNANDEGTWGPVTKAIPALKTKAVIRLKPLEKKAAATQPAK